MFDGFCFLSKSPASSISKLIPKKEDLRWHIHEPEICFSASLALYCPAIVKIEERAWLMVFSVTHDVLILTAVFIIEYWLSVLFHNHTFFKQRNFIAFSKSHTGLQRHQHWV